jgi:hypothetical protein
METLGDNLVAFSGKKMAYNYWCEYCDYKCCKKYNWDKHLSTSKHKSMSNGDIMLTKSGKKWQEKEKYQCENCGKQYQHRQCLWRHKKTCSNNCDSDNVVTNNNVTDKNVNDNNDKLIDYILKENTEIKELILEIMKNGTTINNTANSNNTTTNSHNKAFNLNFFLNETCKNAMNITDFVDSIKLQLSDFMDVGEAGFVKGISNIIVKKLKSLDETVRPIHCTDQKRETFYVKDENKWEKEEEDLKNIRIMIKKVIRKNEGLMQEYKKEFPDYMDPDSKRSDQYSKFVIEALGGEGDNNKEKENRIINHISKATTIKTKNT